MSERASGSAFSAKLIALVIAIAVMSFGAILTLLAWGPDLQSKDRAGDHAFSSSALGYGGLVELLKLQGREVTVSRSRQTLNGYDAGLLILTPGSAASALEDHLPMTGPVLVILPKWNGQRDALKPSWYEETELSGQYRAERILGYFEDVYFDDQDTEIDRIIPPNLIRSRFGQFRPQFDERLQIIQSGDYLQTVIPVPTGALLAKIPSEDIYFLSDPDLANTFGLADPENARLMLSILQTISAKPDTPVIFDTTLNGFERSTSLLRIMLDIPFIGATLTVLCGFLLLGWAACIRFGAPVREEKAFALGKQALADNTAGLFSMTRRETRMAPGYLALSRKAIRRDLGIPPTLSEDEVNALLERLGPDEKNDLSWTSIVNAMQRPSNNRDDLLNKAQALYAWRKEKTHGDK